MYSESDIINLIDCGETSTVQFKQEFTTQRQMATEMIAFANSRGGVILIGVVDKTGEIVGLNFNQIRAINTELSNTANEHIRPTIYLQTQTVNVRGHNILAVIINEGMAKPYKDLNGNIWVKQGADKRRVTENSEILRLFATSKIYNPDENSVPGTSIDDIDNNVIDKYLEKVYGKGPADFGMPYDKLLENLRITDTKGTLTLAGLLYFGKKPQRLKPSFCIKAVSYYGNDIGGTEYRDSRDIEGTIPDMFDQAMKFLDMNLFHIQSGQSFNSLGRLEISKVALEEILQNALVHREYIKSAPIRLLIFDNRIEIISPGALPDGLTVEMIKVGNTTQRNELIATFCTRTMHYRGLGSGIIRALKEDANIVLINDQDGNQFKAILPRYKESHQVDSSSKVAEPSSNWESHQVEPTSSDGESSSNGTSHQAESSSKDAQIRDKILEFCESPHTLKEIINHVGLSDRVYFKKKYINPLLSVKLQMTDPKSPKSPKQKYITIKEKLNGKEGQE